MLRELIADIKQTLADRQAQEAERKRALAELEAQEQERRRQLAIEQEAQERRRHLVITSTTQDHNGNTVALIGDCRERVVNEVRQHNPMTGTTTKSETSIAAHIVCLPEVGLAYNVRTDELTVDGRKVYGDEAVRILQLMRGHRAEEPVLGAAIEPAQNLLPPPLQRWEVVDDE